MSEIIKRTRLSKNDIDRFSKYFCESISKLESEKNRKKPYWLDQDELDLYIKCLEENEELHEEFLMKDNICHDRVIDELKDRINTALILWDKIEHLKNKKR